MATTTTALRDGIPGNDFEADSLRAYIPTDTLKEIAAIRDLEIAASDKRRSVFDDASAKISTIKERMRRDRIALKALEKKMRDYFATPLFPRLDAARDAAWIAACRAMKFRQLNQTTK